MRAAARLAAAVPLVAGAFGLVPAALAGQAEPPLEILHGFTLIDGLGGPPVADAAIAFRGDRIVATGPRADVLRAPGAEAAVRIDVGGGFVVPGLIDAHVHLATSPDRAAAEAELGRLLRAGVTTVRDMAGDARELAVLARDVRAGRIEGPDVHFSAVVAGPSFFEDPRARSATLAAAPGAAPWMQAFEPASDAPLAVALARGTSASGIKVYADLDREGVERITRAAHEQGMLVWAHGMVHPARPLEVVRSGVDGVSHVCSLAWEAMAEAPTRYHQNEVPSFALFTPDAAVFDELLGEMAARGTILDATLAMYLRNADTCATHAPALVRRAHAMGVPVAAGTDFSTPPGEPPALLLEIEALVEAAGLTPLEAIAAATRVSAAATGVEHVVGTLQSGRRLDFVLLARDPAADVRNLRAVREVWKGATRHPVGG